MSGNESDLFGGSRATRAAAWALLLAYVALVIYEGRTGSPAARSAMDVLFGALMIGVGGNVIHRYGAEPSLLTAAAGFFLLGGLLHLVRSVLAVPVTVAAGADFTVLLGLVAYVLHRLRSWR